MPENPPFDVQQENGEARSASKSMNEGERDFRTRYAFALWLWEVEHGMKDRWGAGEALKRESHDARIAQLQRGTENVGAPRKTEWRPLAIAVEFASKFATGKVAIHADRLNFVAITIKPDRGPTARVATVGRCNVQRDFAVAVRTDNPSKQGDSKTVSASQRNGRLIPGVDISPVEPLAIQ